MNDSDTYQSVAARLSRLAPYAAIAGGMFAGIAIAVAIAGIYDIKRSVEELPARVAYSTIMTAAFAISFGIAAYYSIKAYVTLKKFGVNPTGENLERSIRGLVAFFRAFFFWLMVTLVAVVVILFVPVF